MTSRHTPGRPTHRRPAPTRNRSRPRQFREPSRRNHHRLPRDLIDVETPPVAARLVAIWLHQLVVMRAQQRQVVERRHPTSPPRPNMVRLARRVGLVATREDAATVAKTQRAPDSRRDQPLGATHVQHLRFRPEHHRQHVGVASEATQRARRHLGTGRKHARSLNTITQRGFRDGDNHPWPVPHRRRRPAVALHQRHQRVGLTLLWRAIEIRYASIPNRLRAGPHTADAVLPPSGSPAIRFHVRLNHPHQRRCLQLRKRAAEPDGAVAIVAPLERALPDGALTLGRQAGRAILRAGHQLRRDLGQHQRRQRCQLLRGDPVGLLHKDFFGPLLGRRGQLGGQLGHALGDGRRVPCGDQAFQRSVPGRRMPRHLTGEEHLTRGLASVSPLRRRQQRRDWSTRGRQRRLRFRDLRREHARQRVHPIPEPAGLVHQLHPLPRG